MCGICFCLHRESITFPLDLTPLNARGPDFKFQMEPIRLSEDLNFTLAGSVLALRGSKLRSQPFIDDSGNILLYNGEIYQGPFDIPIEENDGEILSNYLRMCKTDSDIIHCVSKLEGCFAFVYYQKQTNKFYYGRDRLGRRSLLCSSIISDSQSIALPFIISSVRLNNFEYTELDANVLHTLTIQPSNSSVHIEIIPYVSVLIEKIISNPPDALLNELESTSTFQKIANEFVEQLQSAVRRRLTNLPTICRQCKRIDCENLRRTSSCQHSKLGILFSGGIDSTVLAVLADRILPIDQPIDLLNVIFYSDVKLPAADRQTGLQALSELNSARTWNFVQIDISIDELRHHRDETIKAVLYPCATVLDDSIGSALWFAARGQGVLNSTNEFYDSPAEVLLSGLGADEQLAGYSRHRSTFQNGGWTALADELDMEMNRISKRNLGRDDRVIASVGKEVRFPFLDEQFVEYLRSVPVWYKTDLRLARGIGEKYLLRYVARQYLNLHRSSTYPKRAIQFGSRIAKLENRKEKASDPCDRLLTKSNRLDDDDEN